MWGGLSSKISSLFPSEAFNMSRTMGISAWYVCEVDMLPNELFNEPARVIMFFECFRNTSRTSMTIIVAPVMHENNVAYYRLS